MPSATGSLKIMFLTAVRPISSLGSAVKSTCLLAAHPGHRPITYSVLQSTLRLVSTTSKVRTVATKKKKKPGGEEDDFESAAWENYDSVQETANVDLYNMPPGYKFPQDVKKAHTTKVNHHKIHQFLKHYESTADHLAKHDRKVLRMLEAIKEPMMEQIKPRSALINTATCKKVCHLFGDLKNPETVIALGNPGTGLISQELVRQGAKNLFLFETNSGIRKHLVDIHKSDKGVSIVEQHLFTNNWVHTETDCKLVRILESDEFKSVKVIHSLTNPMQFPILVTLYTANHMPYYLKNTELFFFSKPDYAAKLVDSCSTLTSQRKFSIWRKFVKTESLITLDANAFFPPFVTEGLGRGPYKHGHVTLVRCTFPAIEYNGKPLTVEERHLYFTFLRHCMATSSAPVVQTLEKWSPGIGAKLICQGFPLFIPFTGLTDEQFLGVFMTFLQHVPAESPIWSLIAGPKYHVKFSETPSSS